MRGLPALDRLQREDTRRVAVINLSFEPIDRVRRYLADHPMRTVHAWSPKSALPPLLRGATRVKPITFVIDKQGVLRRTLFGTARRGPLKQAMRRLL